MVLSLELIKPNHIEVDEGTLTAFYGKLTIQPLERGYGYTVGNAIRRTLLSSLMGAAITGIEVDGSVHEFSAIPDVREDLTELILNLKQVQLKLHGEGPVEITLNVKGPGVVTAGDFETNQKVEILNPKHVLANVGDGGRLKLRAIVEMGRGFATSEENKNPSWPLGRIAIDAIFSPIRKVNFEVSNARVGQRTDYDKLVFEIVTDGSVKPVEAVSIASNLLQEQLTVFSNFSATPAVGRSVASHGTIGGAINPLFLKPVRELELANRSINSLEAAGVMYLGDLVQLEEAALAEVKNFGKKSLDEVKDLLKTLKLSLGTRIEGWPPQQLERQK